MGREAWRVAGHGVAESRTRLSDWTELRWLKTAELYSLTVLKASSPLFIRTPVIPEQRPTLPQG